MNYLGSHSLRFSKDGENWSYLEVDSKTSSVKIDSLKENTFYSIQLIEGDELFTEAQSQVHTIHTISPSAFKFISSKDKEGASELYWGINAHDFIEMGYTQAIIKFNTKVGKKHGTHEWGYAIVDLDALKHKLEELAGATSYVFNIGIPKDGNAEAALTALNKGESVEMVWSKEGKFKPKRVWGILKLLMLIGALGFFIFGMKMMSEGLQRAAGSRLRSMLGSMTANRVRGVFSGFFITGIVQSSSANYCNDS